MLEFFFLGSSTFAADSHAAHRLPSPNSLKKIELPSRLRSHLWLPTQMDSDVLVAPGVEVCFFAQSRKQVLTPWADKCRGVWARGVSHR